MLVLSTYCSRSIAGKPQSKKDIELSEEELGLICRALSDSMNHKKEDRFQEKWDLLLKCKAYQVRLKNEEVKENNA